MAADARIWTARCGELRCQLTDAEVDARVARDGADVISSHELRVGSWSLTRQADNQNGDHDAVVE